MPLKWGKAEGMTKAGSALIVEERGILPGMGAAQQEENNVQDAEGMVILLCVVEGRVRMQQRVLVGIHRVLILWGGGGGGLEVSVEY